MHLTINQLTNTLANTDDLSLLAKVTRYVLASVIALPAGTVDEYGVTDGYSTSAPQKLTFFDGHYLRNHSTLDIGVLGYIGMV